MGVALHGNLRDFGVGEVFQLIGHQRKTGVLEVSSGEERVRITFDHGAVVSGEPMGSHEGAALADMLVRVGLLTPDRRADLEDEAADGGLPELLARELGRDAIERVVELLTQETLFDLLRRQKGSFHFVAGPVSHRRDPGRLLPAEQILMDGLRMVDEWRALDPMARRDECVFERSGDFASFRADHPGEPAERLATGERLFLLIDGRIPVRRVIDLSRLGSFEAARWLSRLHEAGVIQVRETVAPPERRANDRAPLLDLGRILAALPFAVLLALVATGVLRPSAGPASADPRLAADPLDGAVTAAATLRLGRHLEMRRFLPEGIPRSLEGLGPVAEPPATLAGGRRPAYYFEARDGSYVLLAPDVFAAGDPGTLEGRRGSAPGGRH